MHEPDRAETIRRIASVLALGGHLKTGQSGTLQNRPTETGKTY